MQVRNKYSGKIYVVAESRLSQLPSELQKQNVVNGSINESKAPKTKGSGNKKPDEVNAYEVLQKMPGASLVGTK